LDLLSKLARDTDCLQDFSSAQRADGTTVVTDPHYFAEAMQRRRELIQLALDGLIVLSTLRSKQGDAHPI
jgi:hypothetical protein